MLSETLKIHTTSETKNVLRKEAEKRGITLSELVRIILNEEIIDKLGRGPLSAKRRG